MKHFFDLFTAAAFFVAYKWFDIFLAVQVVIALYSLQVLIHWIIHRQFDKMQLCLLGLIVLLGGPTLIFHNEAFFKWKPTLVYWLFAAVLIGGQFIGKLSILQRAMGDKIELPQHAWTKLSISWILYFFLMGITNLFVVLMPGAATCSNPRMLLSLFFYLLSLPAGCYLSVE